MDFSINTTQNFGRFSDSFGSVTSSFMDKYFLFNPGLNSDHMDNVFDNKEITLKKYPVGNTGEVLYNFIWYSNGKRKEFTSHQSTSEDAIAEFKGIYPAAKCCYLNEIATLPH